MRTTCGVLVLLAAAAAQSAELKLDYEPTPELPGYWTWTFTLATGPGETFRGVVADVESFGMNQVTPLDMATPFTDLNALFPFFGALPEQDTQFLFSSDEVLAIGVVEREFSLSGAISGLSMITSDETPFLQLVTTECAGFWYTMSFDIGAPEAAVFSGGFICPEPRSVSMLTMSLMLSVGLAPVSRQLAACDSSSP